MLAVIAVITLFVGGVSTTMMVSEEGNQLADTDHQIAAVEAPSRFLENDH